MEDWDDTEPEAEDEGYCARQAKKRGLDWDSMTTEEQIAFLCRLLTEEWPPDPRI